MADNKRLLSLDFFRGITIAAMILVNNPGDWAYVYPPLLHAQWHGWTFTDLIFPFFLFIVGVFTVYMVGTGYRYIRIRNSGGKKGPQIIDWILTVGMAVVGIVFLVMGGYLGFNGDAFGVVYIVFGLISLLFIMAISLAKRKQK